MTGELEIRMQRPRGIGAILIRGRPHQDISIGGQNPLREAPLRQLSDLIREGPAREVYRFRSKITQQLNRSTERLPSSSLGPVMLSVRNSEMMTIGLGRVGIEFDRPTAAFKVIGRITKSRIPLTRCPCYLHCSRRRRRKGENILARRNQGHARRGCAVDQQVSRIHRGHRFVEEDLDLIWRSRTVAPWPGTASTTTGAAVSEVLTNWASRSRSLLVEFALNAWMARTFVP